MGHSRQINTILNKKNITDFDFGQILVEFFLGQAVLKIRVVEF